MPSIMKGLPAIVCLVLAFASAWPVRAQDECGGGTVYDDGSFENAYGARASVPWSEYVMRFDPPKGARRLEHVCVCWTRSSADSSVAFDLNVYSIGDDGKPYGLLGSKRASAVGIPAHPNRRFYSYDVSDLDIEGDDPVFIGPAWSPSEDNRIYICSDQDGPATRPGYMSFVGHGVVPSQPITDEFPSYRSLGVRARFDAPCQPTPTTLCLNENRFKVEIEWRRSNGQAGSGWAVALEGREDSGLFWFFDPTNIELLIKVLDGCDSTFDSFWVFYAATTNVGFDLTVTDTATGETKAYHNAVGDTALPVQDTQAFKTCGADE